MIDDPRIVLPSKDKVYGTMEGLIGHFKLVIDGIKVPPGEVYAFVEGGNGELGFYIVSDGSGHPYKVHCRAPSSKQRAASTAWRYSSRSRRWATTSGSASSVVGATMPARPAHRLLSPLSG